MSPLPGSLNMHEYFDCATFASKPLPFTSAWMVLLLNHHLTDTEFTKFCGTTVLFTLNQRTHSHYWHSLRAGSRSLGSRSASLAGRGMHGAILVQRRCCGIVFGRTCRFAILPPREMQRCGLYRASLGDAWLLLQSYYPIPRKNTTTSKGITSMECWLATREKNILDRKSYH